MIARFLGSCLGAAATTLALGLLASPAAMAEPGITDEKVVLAGTYPLSGSYSIFGAVSVGTKAYFDYVNAEFGGVKMADGKRRKIEFIVADDGFEPARAMSNVSKFVTADEVFAVISNMGSAQGLAARDYLNEEEVPQVFIYTNNSVFSRERDSYPWSGPSWLLTFPTEAAIYAEFIKKERPNGKVAVFMLNNEGGHEMLNSFKAALEGSDVEIATVVAHEPTSPSVDSDVVSLRQSGADVLLNISNAKQASQSIRKVAELGWHPLHVIVSTAAQVEAVLKPAGLENAEGLYTSRYLKDPSDPGMKDDEEIVAYKKLLADHAPSANPDDVLIFHGVSLGDTVVKALEGAQPSRESFKDAVWNMKNAQVFGMFPGVLFNTGPGDNYPIESAVLMQFRDGQWVTEGKVVSYEGKTGGGKD